MATEERPRLALGPAEVTLAQLLESLGGGFLEPATSQADSDVTVSGPVIYDGESDFHIEAHDLLLAVGVDPAAPSAADLVQRAGEDGAAAVVFRSTDGLPEALTAVAERAGVTLLRVPPGTGWGQLFTLTRTAIEASRAATWSSQAGLAVGDLVQLANAIAGTVGGATTIEDPDSNVLAFSSLGHTIDPPRRDTILGHRIPGDWRQILEERGVFKRLYGSDEVLRISDLRTSDMVLTPRMAVAVRAGGEVLGSVWVAEDGQPFDDAAAEALRGAARIAALHMLHHRAAGDLERQRRGELIRALLSGLDLPPPGLAGLGLTSGTPLTVVAVAPDLGQTPEPEVALSKVVSVITLYAEVYRHRASAVAVDGVVYVMLPADTPAEHGRLLAFAGELVTRAEAAIGTRVTAGVGSTAAELRDVQLSRREADDVLRVLSRLREETTVAHVDDLRGHIALMKVEDLAVGEPQLRGGKLQRLVDHDRQHGTNHVDTLRAYLDHFGDVPRAADSLSIHRNTFRYRLGRLVEVSGLDLHDPDERLITDLQLRFIRQGGRG